MFNNRKQAALVLAKALEKYKGKDVIIAGIPRGGIETAFYVARELKATLSAIIVRKLGYPENPEYAFGAIAEDGSTYYIPNYKNEISPESINRIKKEQRQEIEKRKQLIRTLQPFPDLKDKTIIIVDDGIATGATIFAAIKMCKKKGAAKIVVAAPVSSGKTKEALSAVADEVVILVIPEVFHAVSQVYLNFENVSDKEAVSFLQKQHQYD